MADQIAINVKVIDNEVRPKLAQLKADITSTFASLDRTVGAGGTAGSKQFQASIAKTKSDLLAMVAQTQAARNSFRASFRGSEEGARGLLERLHGLGPILAPLGLEIGNIRGLMAAARFGAVGLAGVIGGDMLVNLAKMGDQLAKTKQRVADVFGGEFGKKVFGDLQGDAKSLGTDVSSFARPLEDLQSASRAGSSIHFITAPGHEGVGYATAGYEQQRQGLKALFEAMRAGGASTEEATKGLSDFTAALRKQSEEGKSVGLTVQMVTELANVSPRAANALAQALGKQDATALEQSLRQTTVSLSQLTSAFPQLAALTKGSFDASAPKTFGDALDALKHKFDELAKAATGDDLSGAMAKAVNAISQGVDSIRETFQKLDVEHDPAYQAAKKFVTGFVAASSPKNATPFSAATGASPDTGVPFGANIDGQPPADVTTPVWNNNFLRRPNAALARLMRTAPAQLPATARNGYTSDQIKALEQRGYIEVSPGKWTTRTGIPHERIRGAEEEVPRPDNYQPEPFARGGPIDENLAEIIENAKGLDPGQYTLDEYGNIVSQKDAAAAKRRAKYVSQFGSAFSRMFGGSDLAANLADISGSFARGGVIKGPGTSTSDSILIRASRDEGIVSARGMARIGKSGLDAINGYAGGGALGGRSGGPALQPVHVHIGDNEYPMQAHPEVADRIISDANDRTAGRRIRRSTGTKTSAWG